MKRSGWRRWISTAALVVVIPFATSCGSGDENKADAELERGGRTVVELTVTASQVFGGQLLTCDFVSLRTNDDDNALALDNLDIDVVDAGKSGSQSCTARVDLEAHADAIPGEYRIDLRFTYTYTDSTGLLTGSDDGRIRVNLLP